MSVLLETPSDMHRMATQLRAHADTVRDHARLLTVAAGHTRWRSPAAVEFQAQVDALTLRMVRSAQRVDDAAHALDQHARCVHARISAPLHLARSVLHTVGG